jgi:DNA-binding response OmpR family regulator
MPLNEADMRHLVLVVENDEDRCDRLAILLTKDGYRTAFAGTIEEAQAFLAATEPSAILLGLRLPDGDGLDLLNAIREGEMSRVPIVVLPDREADSASTQPAMTDWLVTPHDETELLAALRHAVNGSGLPETTRSRIAASRRQA